MRVLKPRGRIRDETCLAAAAELFPTALHCLEKRGAKAECCSHKFADYAQLLIGETKVSDIDFNTSAIAPDSAAGKNDEVFVAREQHFSPSFNALHIIKQRLCKGGFS